MLKEATAATAIQALQRGRAKRAKPPRPKLKPRELSADDLPEELIHLAAASGLSVMRGLSLTPHNELTSKERHAIQEQQEYEQQAITKLQTRHRILIAEKALEVKRAAAADEGKHKAIALVQSQLRGLQVRKQKYDLSLEISPL